MAKKVAIEILKFIVYIGCIYLVAKGIVTFLGQRTIVDGPSMQNTLQDGDNVILDKISYRFHDPKRFDIVVFPVGEDHYIKRIIGLPGEKVRIDANGLIYINGEMLAESYGLEVIQGAGVAAEEITLSDSEYFVLGDNRNNSKDSRSEMVGNIQRKNIEGKVVARFFPFSEAKIL